MDSKAILDHSTAGQGIRVLSLFAGAGGLDLGFDLAGFEVVYATDLDSSCCKTLQLNLGGVLRSNTHVEQADIRQLDLRSLPEDIDLIIGGPPCQSFSASGRRAGGAPGRLDERGTLFEMYCRIIEVVRPRAFLFENVRGILGTNKGEDWKVIVSSFQRLGYRVSFRILDALDYGAPQQRERMILVGHQQGDAFWFPAPLFGPDSPDQRPHRTAGEALLGLVDHEDTEPLVLSNGKYGHLLRLVPPGENYLHFTEKRGYPRPIFAYRSRFSDFLYKANPAAPIKTLIARPGKYTGPFHWENRSFTVREYMRLQGFPDGYVFHGSRDDAIKQIGNSVSPKLAYQLALAIAKQIFAREAAVELLAPEKQLSFDKRKGQKAQRTRELHHAVRQQDSVAGQHAFSLVPYSATTLPTSTPSKQPNTVVAVAGRTALLEVHADQSKELFATLRLEIAQSRAVVGGAETTLEVTAYGESAHTIQTLWNAVDAWVVRTSGFHSLFELYGHFTEPHPIFKIVDFTVHSNQPIGGFAKHVSEFSNCSKYFPQEHLTQLFGCQFNAVDFLDLVKMLRRQRFDIRCHETNRTIPEGVYMVSYPFTLPFGKQMNFAVRSRAAVEGPVQRPLNLVGLGSSR